MMAQNIHALVPGNCNLPAQRKDARNFHCMMQERQQRHSWAQGAIK
jgi:hypothetical protein